jgi:cysteinyl-tRNA synthetase
LFNNEKMAKSQGNFFTLRDLVLRGFKPSSIRFLLASVPYRTQLNFTFDSLQQAAAAVERLRNFHLRLTTTQFPEGLSEGMAQLASATDENLRAGMEDDLNTAQAQGAIFEMIRAANAAMDGGALRNGDVPQLLAVLQKFDDIFSVLKDDDVAKVKGILDWARAEGREKDISVEAADIARSAQLSDDDVNKKLAEIEAARRTRDFKTSDALRAELAAAGILVEFTKAGVRWRRK